MKISVLIPVYNAQDYIRDCLETVLNQTHPASEVIVINDGSTDSSLSILQSFGSKIKILDRKENLGPAYSINEGIKKSKHNWLTFLDADDLWEKTTLQSHFEALSSSEGAKVALGYSKQFICPTLDEKSKSTIHCYKNAMPGFLRSAIIIHKSIFPEVGFFNPNLIIGDFIDWFQKLKEKKIPYIIHENTVHYRRLSKSSLSNRLNLKDGFTKLIKAKIDRQRFNENLC